MKLDNLHESLEVTNANLVASFTNVSMVGVRFEDVNLAFAQLHDVNISDGTITDANLTGLAISKSTLSGMTIDGILVTELLARYRGT